MTTEGGKEASLVERLELAGRLEHAARCLFFEAQGGDRNAVLTDPIFAEAAARIRVLEAALRPFAEACAHLHPSQPDDAVTLDGFEARDFRRAAQALSSSHGGGN